MFRLSRVLFLSSAMLAAATLASAQSSTPPTKSNPTKSQTTAPASSKSTKPAAHTTLVATGKIASFDAASNMLTVTTSKGDVQFKVDTTSHLTDGSKTIKADALSGLAAHEARVQYTEKDGVKTAASVRVSAPAKGKTPKK
jgi:hypothetical protein